MKLKTKYWVEIYDGSRVTYNTNSQIKFKISKLKSNLIDYSDTYITVVAAGTTDVERATDEIINRLYSKNQNFNTSNEGSINTEIGVIKIPQ